MLSRLRPLLLLPLAALAACGSGSPSVPANSSTPPAGDYVITVAAGTSKSSYFSGDLAVSGNSVSGVFRYTNLGTICVSSGQDIAFTGNFGNNVLTLTSASFAGSVATFTINLPVGATSNGTQVANGSAVITGGSCALTSTTAQAQYIPSLSGTWSGAMTGTSSGTASITLTESAANSDGQFPVTGAASFNSTACNFSLPISTPLSGLLSGGQLSISSSDSSIGISANATTSPVAFSLTLNQSAEVPASCAGSYSGNLTN